MEVQTKSVRSSTPLSWRYGSALNVPLPYPQAAAWPIITRQCRLCTICCLLLHSVADSGRKAMLLLSNNLFSMQTLMDADKRAAYDALMGFTSGAINPFNDKTHAADKVTTSCHKASSHISFLPHTADICCTPSGTLGMSVCLAEDMALLRRCS